MQGRSFQRNLIVFFFFIFFSSGFLASLTVSSVFAQNFPASIEQIVPFLNEKDVVVVHLDLRKADPEDWIKRFTAFAEERLPQWGFDRKSCRGILQEWNLLVPKKMLLITEPFNRLTKEAGVLDLYFIAPVRKADEEETTEFLVVSMRGKNDKQKQTVRDIARDIYQWSFSSEEEPAFEEFKEALILPITAEIPIKEDMDKVREYLGKIKPVAASLLAEVWKNHETDLIRGAVLPSQGLSERLGELAEEENLDQEPFKSFIESMQNDLRWVSFGFNVEELRFRKYIQMKDEAGAKNCMDNLKKLVDYGAEKIEQNLDENEILHYISRLATVSFEEVARQVMPKQEGDRIVATIDSSNFMLYYSAFSHLGFLVINE